VLDKNAKITLVGEWMNNDKAETAYSLATDMMTVNPDLKGIYVTAGGPSGAAKAVEDAGKTGQIAIVCHDVLAESAPYIESGAVKACLDQDPFNQGYQPVVAAFNKLVAGQTPDEYTWYEGIVATPETVKSLFPELL
jgi:ABC-type sugar transport system substrate-binding protein